MFRCFSTYVGCTVHATIVRRTTPGFVGQPYKATCKYTSSGCPVEVHFYRKERRKTYIFELVESRFWWVERGVPARETCTEIEKNKIYECNLEIDVFSTWHSATYVCLIREKNNLQNKDEYEFFAEREF